MGTGATTVTVPPSTACPLPAPTSVYRLTSHGRSRLTTFGVDLPAPGRERRAIRYCVDWSEQRHHLAGPLGAALTDRMFDLGWLRRTDQRRVVHLTDAGRHGLHDTFGVPEDWDERA